MRAFSLVLCVMALAVSACGDPPTDPSALPGLSKTGVVVAALTSSGLDQPWRGAVTVTLRGGATLSFADSTTPMVFSSLASGQHTLTLAGAGANCSVQGNPRTVTVGSWTPDTVRTTFERSCVAAFGAIAVTITTTGEDQDRAGYTMVLDTRGYQGAPNGISYINGIVAGEHQVRLIHITKNCTAENGNQRTVTVTAGGAARDTAATAFQVTCVSIPHIAFTSTGSHAYASFAPYVTVAGVAGGEARHVTPDTPGHSASWSPDGRRMVFVAQDDCYYTCQQTGLAVADLDSGQVTKLTSEWNDKDPAWSPDGTQILFERAEEIMVMNADGSSLRTLVARDTAAGRHLVGAPTWSPDGTRIAFTCVTKTGTPDAPVKLFDICLASADGTGIVRLASDAHYDADPSWSPDGTRLAITTDRGTTDGTREVAVMNADGSNLTRLAAGRRPAWSPDGTRILFEFEGSLTVAYGLFIISADGTNLTRYSGYGYGRPAWQPWP